MNPSPSPHPHSQTLGMAMSHPPQQLSMGPPPSNGPSGSSSGLAAAPGSLQQPMQQQQQPTVYHPSAGYPGSIQGGQMHMVQLPPGQAGVFGGVMGAQGPQGGTKVYASVYSGIPVFEAMIRGISVMRRSSDSWVNATQILKVAGIPKSQRTKILDKEILTGLHEKVQGGYGKYQGTWIPFQRGQEVAAQYGVTQYLAPIFDFVPSPSNVAALPVNRGETPDRGQKRPSGGAALGGSSGGPAAGYNAMLSAQTPQARQAHHIAPSGSAGGPPSSASRVYSPMHPTDLPPPPPPHFGNGDMMMAQHQHQQQHQLHHQSLYQPMYFAQPPGMMAGRSADGLGPPVDLNGYGLPPSHSDVYIDQFGQPHSMHFANGLLEPPPSKRLKAEPGLLEADEAMDDGGFDSVGAVAEVAQAEDDDSDDEIGDKPPLPSSMRLSSKPIRPKLTAAAGKTRSKMMELFQGTETVDVRALLGIPPAADNEDAEGVAEAEAEKTVDIDTIIDDQGHTALHWAASLAQLDLVRQLVDLGADINRGNYAGETALMRSVLTTNHAEANSFPQLLQHLAPSVRTLDQAYRTVIHHIALVAGVKGRASSARQYMTGVLEWVAKEQQQQQPNSAAMSEPASATPGNGTANANGTAGNAHSSVGHTTINLKTLIDVQDIHGDTALNIAARVGNKGLVGLLIDAGADKARANKLGLKPADFGVEIEALKISPAEAVVSNLKSEVPKPERHSRDVQKNIAAIFETVNETFTTEMLAKQTKLNAIEASVRHATRALADKRQQVALAQAALGEVEQVKQKSDNVRNALSSIAEGDWTGCAPLSSESASGTVPAAFRAPVSGSAEGTGEEIALPSRGEEGALLRLRRMMIWEDRIAATLQDRIDSLQGQGADKAVQYRRLVSLCTKVPVEKVDGMLDDLAAAIESDGNSIDLSRVGNFMSRMKQEQAGQVQAA